MSLYMYVMNVCLYVYSCFVRVGLLFVGAVEVEDLLNIDGKIWVFVCYLIGFWNIG